MQRKWRSTAASIAVALLTISRAFAAPSAAAPTVPLGTPMFAKVEGTGTLVNLSWWAVKGAAVGYEILRATDPQAAPTTLATLASGTLGYADTQPAAGAQYYQLVALGAGNTRSASAWILLNTPTISNVTVGASDTVIAWSTAQPAPAGYEIWRTPNLPKAATRVGITATGVLTYHDKQPAGGAQYYQVVAIGGGARAASPWFLSGPSPVVAPGAGMSGGVAPSPVSGANATVTAKTNMVGVSPAQATAKAPVSSTPGLGMSSPSNGGWSTDPKVNGMLAAVMAAIVEIIDAVITVIVNGGGAVTDQDRAELIVAANLASVSAVAAVIVAVITTIQELPSILAAHVDPMTMPYQLTQAQVDQVILSIPPPDAATSRFTNDVKALLRKIKTR